jgi:hypothetical protein
MGTNVSPPMGDTFALIGRDEVLYRLDQALAAIA